MKKIIPLLLMLTLVLSGCFRPKMQEQSVAFYYPVSVTDYSIGASYLKAEIRSNATTGKILMDTVNLYLQGPLDKEVYGMPFPPNTKVQEIVIESRIMHITLNRGFAVYSGLPLTIACACIAKTAMELTGVEGVRIYADGTVLDGAEFIEINADSLLLVDRGVPMQE